MTGITSTAVFVAAFALSVGLAAPRLRAQSSPAPLAAAEPSPKKAEEVYDNIQALQGVPYGQLIPAMQLMAESLGVDCEFCHDAEKRELDAKATKQVARKMMQMVFAINREVFGGRPAVTCYSCHRGSTQPADMPALASPERKPEPVEARRGGATSPMPDAATMPTADQLLDRYVAALGGAAALQKISSRVEKGSVMSSQPGRPPSQLRVETFAKVPDKRFTKGFSVTHLGNSAAAFGVYHGGAGWLREGSSPVRVMFDWRLDAAQLEDTLNFPARVRQILSQLRVEAAETVGGREAYVLSGRTRFLPLVKLYFDKDSGLLARLVYYTETVVGRVPSQIDYADYREVDGQEIPFRRTVTLVRGIRATYQMDEVQHNIPIDESKFAIPSPLPSLYK